MHVRFVAEKTGQLQFTSDIPEHLKTYTLRGARCQAAAGAFGYMLRQQLRVQHFYIQYNRFCFSENEQLTVMREAPLLELQFNLEAPIGYHFERLGNLSFLKSSYNIIYLPALSYELYCEKDVSYQTFSVHFHRDYLFAVASHFSAMSELLQHMRIGQASVLHRLCPAAPIEVLNIIQEILKCKYSGEVLQIYLTARITELLFLCFEQDVLPPLVTSIHLWKTDLDGIEATRRDMLENPQQAFSLAGLALKAGMNKDKLSRGFRMVVGTPLFDYLLQARMSKAKLLLLTTEFSVSDIGYEVGYQDIHSFSKAFKKFYGLSPHQYRKKFERRH